MPVRHGVIAVAALALIPFGAPAEAQRDRSARQRSTIEAQSIDTTFRMERGGVVDLELTSGNIIVTGTTGNQVRIRATAEQGRIELRASSTLARLRAEPDDDRDHDRMRNVRYEVAVPAGVRVLMGAVSGTLVARGVEGELDVELVSGSVELRDIGGMVNVEAVSGPITASGLRGGVHIEATSGSVSIDGVDGEVLIENTTGPVTLSNIRSRRVSVESVSGVVRFQGVLESGGRYEFESHSGSIHLTLPAATGAQLTLSTFSGSIQSQFPITLEPRSRSSEKRLEFRLGNGGARVNAETFSGNISVTRGTGRDQQE